MSMSNLASRFSELTSGQGGLNGGDGGVTRTDGPAYSPLPGEEVMELEDQQEPTRPEESQVESTQMTAHSVRSVRSTATLSGTASPVVRHTHEHLKKTRLLEKNGTWNISYAHQRRKRTYISDIFTTIVEAKWRYTLLIFGLGFVLSWVLFAVLWYVICLAHGDFDEHDPEEKFVPCVNQVFNFTSILLFSIETQHTIGYGSRHITEECVEAIIILIVQSATGVLIQCIVAGMVFSKIARPKKRAETLVFSKNAVVSLRDGQLCFMFRVGDMRKSHLLGASVTAEFIRKKVTCEGEVLPLHQTKLKVGLEAGEETVFMIWPVVVCHRMDEDSPLYGMSRADLCSEHFEILVTVDGSVQSNGMPIQARSSYLPSEVLWGYRFKRMLTWHREHQTYLIDHKKFHAAVPVPCPSLCARDITLAGGVEAVPIDRSMTRFMNMMLTDLGTPAITPEGSPAPMRRNGNGVAPDKQQHGGGGDANGSATA